MGSRRDRRSFFRLRGWLIGVVLLTVLASVVQPVGAGAQQSTDGRILYFSGLALYTMELDGSDPELVLGQVGAAFPADARWAPGGNQIIYNYIDHAPSPNVREIHIMNADGSGDHRVSPVGQSASQPDWSDDGSRIAYDTTSGIVVADPDGSNTVTIPDPPGSIAYSRPRISPDGTMLSVTETHSGTPARTYITVMDIDGTDAETLTDGGFDLSQDWSPDGTMLAYRHSESLPDPSEVRVIPVEGGEPMTITPEGGEDTEFRPYAWTPDGKIWGFRESPRPSSSQTDRILFSVNSDGSDFTLWEDLGNNVVGADWVSGACVNHPFSDVPPWLTAAVNWVYCNQYMTGYEDGTFKPNQSMTRAEIARLLYRVEGSPDVSELPPHGLSDVPRWVEDPVRWHLANQTMTGYPNDTFEPNDPITRGQATRATYRVKGSPGGGSHSFSDIPPWLEESVSWAAEDPDGETPPLMTGYPDDTFRPDDDITRGQVARLICRAYGGPC